MSGMSKMPDVLELRGLLSKDLEVEREVSELLSIARKTEEVLDEVRGMSESRTTVRSAGPRQGEVTDTNTALDVMRMRKEVPVRERKMGRFPNTARSASLQ
jgi:hypothetical protein